MVLETETDKERTSTAYVCVVPAPFGVMQSINNRRGVLEDIAVGKKGLL